MPRSKYLENRPSETGYVWGLAQPIYVLDASSSKINTKIITIYTYFLWI